MCDFEGQGQMISKQKNLPVNAEIKANMTQILTDLFHIFLKYFIYLYSIDVT